MEQQQSRNTKNGILKRKEKRKNKIIAIICLFFSSLINKQ